MSTAADVRPARSSSPRPAVAPPPPPAGPHLVEGWRDTFAGWVGKVVIVAAAWCVIGILVPRSRLVDVITSVLGWTGLPVAPSLFSAVLLALVGGAVRRRLRIGLWFLLVVEALAAASSLLLLVGSASGLAEQPVTPWQYVGLVFSTAIPLAFGVLLLLARGAFRARLERGARWRALGVLVGGIAVSMVVSVALTETFPARLDGGWRRVAWGVRVALGIEPGQDEPNWRGQVGHHWIATVVGLLSAAALVLAAYVFLRSTRAHHLLTAQDELDLRGLLLHHGEADSLGYFALRRDKSVAFGPRRAAAVTYRVVNSVSLASGDPIGPRSAWPGAIDAWLAEARRYGWFPAALSTGVEGAEAYVAAGLKAIPLGDEAIIDVDGFTLDGQAMAPVRRAVARVARAGYRITVHRHADLSAEVLAEVERRAEDWRGDESERGFSMALGRLGDGVDGRCVAVLAHDADGRLRGLLSFVPWGRRGLSLDLMRRDPTSENGLVEAMVAALVQQSRDLGVRRISLNFAMFRGVFSAAERVGAGPMVRGANALLTFASKFWQLESLYRSNARYLPRWETRYLCYDSSLTLTRVAVAAGMAEGFLPAGSPPPVRHGDDDVVLAAETLPFAEAVVRQERAAREGALVPTRRLTQQQRARQAKLGVLEAAGMTPYPAAVPRTTTLSAVRAAHGELAAGQGSGERVSVTGRVRAVRDLGGLVFAVLVDDEVRLQVMVSRESVGDAAWRLFRRTVDLGDHVSVTGEVVRSRRGELSVLASSWAMAAKCLRPLPGERAGFTDVDARVRQRHLDLVVNADAREMIRRRSVGVLALRTAFSRRGYLEVETPMLQQVHGGANARPFVTHINAYDTQLYLRIAPELFLKRLCVGGVGKVFECNRNFRNEGADATHNPEFTSLEAYEAYGDYESMRLLTREVVLEMATAVWGSPVARRGDTEIDLSGDWPVVTVHDAVAKAAGVPVTPDTPESDLRSLCARHGLALPAEASAGDMVLELYEELVEGQTTFPTFYKDFPVEGSPLTRRHRRDPRLAERWDLVAFGAELGTAYTELVDPVEQRDRLVAQSIRAAAGDPEAMEVDEAFLGALEYAMPPTGGLGLGVDRLVMMLTGASIRQTLAFPFVR